MRYGRSSCRFILWSYFRCINTSAILNRPKVAVAMSGGIDSSAAAVLLQEQGYDIVGIFMKNWDGADEICKDSCSSSKDKQDMMEVCRRLKIDAFDVDFSKEYWNEVFTPFLDSYEAGIQTPNPDVFCNRFVKFHHLKKFVKDRLGISTIATGHYCRTAPSQHANPTLLVTGNPSLLKGLDQFKDQSYFLSMTPGSALQDVIFPLGSLTKTKVRELVADRLSGLRVLSKAESMGICFIGKRPMKQFLSEYIDFTPGRFIDVDTGCVVGYHTGQEYYTIGQKARIGGTHSKYYIAAKLYEPHLCRLNARNSYITSLLNPDDNAVNNDNNNDSNHHYHDYQKGDLYVASGAKHPAMYTRAIQVPADSVNWISGQPPTELLTTLRYATQEEVEEEKQLRKIVLRTTEPATSVSDSHHQNHNDYRQISTVSLSSPSSVSILLSSVQPNIDSTCYKNYDQCAAVDDDISRNTSLPSSSSSVYQCSFKSRYNQPSGTCTMQLIHFPDWNSSNISRNRNSNVINVADDRYCSSDFNDSAVPPVINEVYKKNNVQLRILFDAPEKAVTPGQVIAFYQNEICLGGAIIKTRLR